MLSSMTLEEITISNISSLKASDDHFFRVYIIRHGESSYNALASKGEKYISGNSLAIPLTQKGEREAIRAGHFFSSKLPINKSYVIASSTALRAQETARLISSEMQAKHNVKNGGSFDAFTEISHGIWEGKPRDDIYMIEFSKWEGLSAKEKFCTLRLSAGETYEEASKRYINGLESLIKDNPEATLILASHNAAMNALIIELTGQVETLSEEDGSPLPLVKIDNGEILLIELEKGRPIQEASVKCLFRNFYEK